MDEAAGTPTTTGTKDLAGRSRDGSPWRFRVVCGLAVLMVAVVGLLSWQRWYEGAPSLGDKGAATAGAYCGLVTVEHDGRTFQSDVGAPGAAELETNWGNRRISGRLHLDDRHREEHRQWTTTGRFVADDGTEVTVSGSYGGKWSRTSVLCG